jgi:hypothetical protein
MNHRNGSNRSHASDSMDPEKDATDALDSRMENRLRKIESQMPALKRRRSDAGPEGTDGEVTWSQRLRQ